MMYLEWTDIVAISTGYYHTVGLKADGTVVATEYKYDPNNIACDDYTGQCDVSEWTDIVAISAGKYHTVGLKADGTVVATEYIYTPEHRAYAPHYAGQCDVSEWTDIVAISAGDYHTVGLKADGTVVITEYIDDPERTSDDDYSTRYDVSEWKNIKLPNTAK